MRPHWSLIRPRRGIEREFLDHLSSTGLRGAELARLGGWSAYPDLSNLLRAGSVPATDLQLSRFKKLAEAVGYPPEKVFEEQGR